MPIKKDNKSIVVTLTPIDCKKLAVLCDFKGVTKTELIKSAIDKYYHYFKSIGEI